MKKIISTAAAIAFMASATAASADDVPFSGTFPVGPFTVTTGSTFAYGLGTAFNGNVGYNQSGTNASNTEAASPTVANTWVIKGAVQKDCSYYGGNGTSHTIDFGTIGVHNEAATSVGNAFNMVSAATANINTTTAGCNFNNSVTIAKTNGAQGLLNSAPGGYDSNNFQANIPYSVAATFTAGGTGSTGAAGSQTLTAATGDATKSQNYGAWRSSMAMVVNAPAPTKGLVAGNYSDTLTVTLQAL